MSTSSISGATEMVAGLRRRYLDLSTIRRFRCAVLPEGESAVCDEFSARLERGAWREYPLVFFAALNAGTLAAPPCDAGLIVASGPDVLEVPRPSQPPPRRTPRRWRWWQRLMGRPAKARRSEIERYG